MQKTEKNKRAMGDMAKERNPKKPEPKVRLVFVPDRPWTDAQTEAWDRLLDEARASRAAEQATQIGGGDGQEKESE